MLRINHPNCFLLKMVVVAVNFLNSHYPLFFGCFSCFDARIVLYKSKHDETFDVPVLDFKNLDRCLHYTFVITDIQHIMIFALKAFLEKNAISHRFVFVQHGELNHENNTGGKLLKKFCQHFKVLSFLISTFGLSSFRIALLMFSRGTTATLRSIRRVDFISHYFVWNAHSLANIEKLFTGGGNGSYYSCW